MPTTEAITQDIDARLDLVRDEVARLEAARKALTGRPAANGRTRRGAVVLRSTADAQALMDPPARKPRARVKLSGHTLAEAVVEEAKRKPRARKPAANGKPARTPRKPSSGRGRPRGGKYDQAIMEAVSASPGITVADVAGGVGVASNYVYRVLPRLAVERRDGGLFPKASDG